MSEKVAMTPERRAKIEARLAAATPGPWVQRETSSGRWLVWAPDADPEAAAHGMGESVLSASTYPGQEGKLFASPTDAALIVHAPTDIADLLAALREAEQRAEAERARADAAEARSVEQAKTIADLAAFRARAEQAAVDIAATNRERHSAEATLAAVREAAKRAVRGLLLKVVGRCCYGPEDARCESAAVYGIMTGYACAEHRGDLPNVIGGPAVKQALDALATLDGDPAQRDSMGETP